MDQTGLFPTSLLSTSIFQKGKRPNAPSSLSSSSSQHNSSSQLPPNPPPHATPISVPQTEVTQLHPDDYIKREPISRIQMPPISNQPSSLGSMNLVKYNNDSNNISDRDTRPPDMRDGRGAHPDQGAPKSRPDRPGPVGDVSDRRRSDERRYDGAYGQDFGHHPDDYYRSNRPPRPPLPAHNSSDDYWDRDGYSRPPYGERGPPERPYYDRGGYYRERPSGPYDDGYNRGRPHDDSGMYKRRKDSISPEPRKKPNVRPDDGIAKLISSSSALDISAASPTTDRNSRSANHASDTSDLETPVSNHSRPTLTNQIEDVVATTMRMDIDQSASKSARRSKDKSKSRKDKKKTNQDSSESSSSSGSSSDSDSDSDESGNEDQRVSNLSRLKVHGEIHDLILELEKTRAKHAKYSDKAKIASKKIRDISRKLERRFRDLSDMSDVVESEPASSSGRGIVSVKPASNSDRRISGSRSVVPVAATRPPPTTTPMASSSASGSSKRSLAQAKQPRVMAIGTATVVETLTNIQQDVRSKAFQRKPRSMVVHTPIAGPELEEVMVTSSLDGNIQFWDLEARRVVTTIPKAPLNQPWAEDMCWVGRNVLAVASATKEGVELNHQLTLIHVKNTPQKSNLGSLNAGSSLAWTIQTLEQKPHDISKGAIMCMSAMTEDASGMSLATAGMDKQIVHWKFTPQNSDGDYVPIHQKVIHTKHTSTIQALSYSGQRNILYSGGSDCKIIGWDMVRSEIVLEHKSAENGRITHIQQNPADPNLFLIGHATTNNQMTLHDSRQQFHVPVLTFGFQCSDNLSRNIAPSWHPDGALVSSGTQSDAKINIWDVRWKDVQRGAGQSICVHEKRVFKAAFHPRRPFMTSMSADSSLAFIDFRLNPGTIVHR